MFLFFSSPIRSVNFDCNTCYNHFFVDDQEAFEKKATH